MGMSDEEKQFIIKFIPTDYLTNELDRRCNSAASMLIKIDDIVSSLTKESTLEDMQIAILKMKEVLY